MIKNLKRAQRALLREGLEEEAAKYDFSPTTYYDPNPNPSPSPNPNWCWCCTCGTRSLCTG